MAIPDQQLKDQLKELAERRSIVEAEINTCSARLKLSGAGMDGKLIDSEVITNIEYNRIYALQRQPTNLLTL